MVDLKNEAILALLKTIRGEGQLTEAKDATEALQGSSILQV